MAKPTASIRVELDTQGLQAELKELNSFVKGSMTEMASSFAVFKTVAGVISDVVGQIAKYARVADEVESIDRRANFALVESGKLRAEQLAGLKALNEERELSLGIDADDQLQLQQKLVLQGANVTKLDEMTRAAIGFAKAQRIDLASAGVLVQKVYEGNVTALQRLGYHVKTTGEAMALFSKLSDAAATEADHYGAKVDIISKQVENLEVSLGKFATNSSTVLGAMTEIAQGINLVSRALDSPSFRWFVDKLAGLALKGGSPLAFFADQAREALGLPTLIGFVSDATKPDNASLLAAGQTGELGESIEEIAARNARAGVLDFGGDRASFAEWKKKQEAARKAAKDQQQREGQWHSAGALRLPASLGGWSPADLENDGPALGGIIGSQEGPGSRLGANAELLAHQWFAGTNKAIKEEAETLKRAVSEYAAQQESIAALVENGVGSIAEGLAGALTNVATSAASGLQGIGQFVGGLLGMLGTLCIQLGTAAILAGALGTAVPLFAGLAGPQSVVLGGVLVAAGIGMKVAGGALGAASTPGGAAASAPKPSAGAGGRSSSSGASGFGSFVPLGATQAEPRNITIHFNQPTEPRAAARMIRDVLREGDQLRNGGW